VREQLKKTSIDTHPKNTPPDIKTFDAPGDNAATPNECSEPSSGDNSSRGRVRRKRSYEDMDAGDGGERRAGKGDRHARKKSRDMSSTPVSLGIEERHIPREAIAEETAEHRENAVSEPFGSNGAIKKPRAKGAQEAINGEKDRHATPPTEADSKEAIVSPKNKRNRDQFLQDNGEGSEAPPEEDTVTVGSAKDDNAEQPATKVAEEPRPKRQRDSGSPQPQGNEDGGPSEKVSLFYI
jgi:Ran-binding protein 3